MMEPTMSAPAKSYDEIVKQHVWNVPERYNIATDVCDKHPDDKLAMVHEGPDGTVREVRWKEQRELANRFANLAVEHGIGREDVVAMLVPPTPEAAAAFLGTYKAGAILLAMSVLYGEEGIRHRIRDSGARLVVTDEAHRDQIAAAVTGLPGWDADGGKDGLPGSADHTLLVLTPEALAAASPEFETVDTSCDDPAQLFYTSGTTGLAKGILHAHRFVLAHEEFELCHEIQAHSLMDALRAPAPRRVLARGRAVLPLPPRDHQPLHHAHGDALAHGGEGRGHAVPDPAAPRVLGRRAAEPRGDQVVP
jgi:acetyl-CoA synthetase